MTVNRTADKWARLAAETLTRGGVIVYPTETSLGLGGDGTREDVARRIQALKHRSGEKTKPLLVLVRDREMADEVVLWRDPIADRLADHFWPGPLTMILPVREGVPPSLHGTTRRLGVRVSPHPFVQKLFEVWDQPLISTSVNLTGESPALTIERAKEILPTGVDLFVESAPCPGGASTVVSLDGGKIQLLREGSIFYRQLARIAPVED